LKELGGAILIIHSSNYDFLLTDSRGGREFGNASCLVQVLRIVSVSINCLELGDGFKWVVGEKDWGMIIWHGGNSFF